MLKWPCCHDRGAGLTWDLIEAPWIADGGTFLFLGLHHWPSEGTLNLGYDSHDSNDNDNNKSNIEIDITCKADRVVAIEKAPLSHLFICDGEKLVRNIDLFGFSCPMCRAPPRTLDRLVPALQKDPSNTAKFNEIQMELNRHTSAETRAFVH